MRKIPTLFERDPDTNRRHVTRIPHPDCHWVLDGEGVPTYKWDGTAVLIDTDGSMWKRREVKPGKPAPGGFRQEGPADPETGKLVGWVLCDRVNAEDRWHWDAWDAEATAVDAAGVPSAPLLTPGTYELIGPKVQGNRHGLSTHRLILHGADHVAADPRTYDALVEWMGSTILRSTIGLEGIVWHHPDGRMAKLKAKDLRELA